MFIILRFIIGLVLISSYLHSKNDLDVIFIKGLKVINVSDGDTITVIDQNKKKYKIRLLGIQAPEIYSEKPWPMSQEAKDFLENLILNQNIDVSYIKSSKKDRYGRILGNVYFKDIWVNGLLVEKGLAFTYILNYDVNPLNVNLLKLENQSIADKINIWSLKYYQVIRPEDAIDHLNSYKIVDGKIIEIFESGDSIWLRMENKKNKGFSVRISKNNEQLLLNLDVEKLKDKTIRLRGFIEQYNKKYGPFIELKQKDALQVVD